MSEVLRTTVCLLLLLPLLSGPALAQEGPPPAAMQELMALQQRAQQVSDELMEIQDATFDSYPELAARRDQLMEDVDAKMIEGGFDAPSQRAEMDSLFATYNDSTTADATRMQLQTRIEGIQTEYQQAQQVALQDSAIQATSTALNEDLMALMSADDPRAEQLLGEMQTIRQRYQALMQQAMQQQMQQQAPVVPEKDGQ